MPVPFFPLSFPSKETMPVPFFPAKETMPVPFFPFLSFPFFPAFLSALSFRFPDEADLCSHLM